LRSGVPSGKPIAITSVPSRTSARKNAAYRRRRVHAKPNSASPGTSNVAVTTTWLNSSVPASLKYGRTTPLKPTPM
jgi:hypothetical protein